MAKTNFKKRWAASRRKARKASGMVIGETRGLEASRRSEVFFGRQHIRDLKKYHDEINVLVTGLTAAEIKAQWADYPKSYSATDILRKECPEAAEEIARCHAARLSGEEYIPKSVDIGVTDASDTD